MLHLIAISLFFINPFLAIAIFYSSIIRNKDKRFFAGEEKKAILILGIICCITVSIVNSVKIPDNDLVWYLEYYQYATNINFLDYISGGGQIGGVSKEPAYTAFVWILNRLFNGNTTAFKFTYSLVEYLFLTVSIISIGTHFKVKNRTIATSIIVLCFLPYIFTMSLQLLRQFMASSILLYLMSRIFKSKNTKEYFKKNVFLIILMYLTHTSSMFFIPLLLIPFLDRPFSENKFRYCILFLGLITYQMAASFLLPFFKSTPLAYLLERSSQDTSFDLGTLALSKIITTIIFTGTAYYIGYIKASKYPLMTGVKRYCNIIIILGLFILGNIHQSELSNRFLFYLFPLFSVFYIINAEYFKFSKLLDTIIVVSIILFWCLYLEIGTWSYLIPMNNVIISPPILYLL